MIRGESAADHANGVLEAFHVVAQLVQLASQGILFEFPQEAALR
jgi:hypothetical protein